MSVSNSRYDFGLTENVNIETINSSNFASRIDMGDIIALATSIKERGLLQPIIVRVTNDNFEIVAGNRRLLAFKKLGRKKIPCYILELSDKDAFGIYLTENLQKRNLNPIEEAGAFKSYIHEQGWGSISELARIIGRSQEYISKRMKLLELPETIQQEIIRHRIRPSLAEELAYVKDKQIQSELAELISRRHLTVRNIRQLSHSENLSALEDIQENVSSQFESDEIIILNKLSVVLKLSLIRVSELIRDGEDNWIIREFLMQQRLTIHEQIDALIRYKKKLIGTREFREFC